jgi:uracil-DNA glycosylase
MEQTSSKKYFYEKHYFEPFIEEEWLNRLYPILGNFKKTFQTIKFERVTSTIYPDNKNMFKAFKLCPFNDVKVLILGQDPYYTPGMATGLAFGTTNSKIPPSLKNIKNEVFRCYPKSTSFDYSLESWAKQGVLLLNTALSVRENKPESHLNIWKEFTEYVLSCLSENVICVLWGRKAQNFESHLEKHFHILKSSHPSPLSFKEGFENCEHFKIINEILRNNGQGEICWANTE